MSATESFAIGRHMVGPDHRPFIIAEMSGNHNLSLDHALAIVDAAAATGAQALKLQTYTADTMTLDVDADEFSIDDTNSLWHGRRLHDRLFVTTETKSVVRWSRLFGQFAGEVKLIPGFDHTAS